MKKFTLSLSLIAFLFSGCGEEAKTKEYYEAHMDEAKAKYNECFNTQSGKGRMSSDKIFATECANAEAIYGKILEEEGRKDAEIAKLYTNLTTLMSDFAAYYVVNAKFADKLSDMTAVKIVNENGLNGSLEVQDKPCINISAITKENKPFLKLEKVSNPSKICKSIYGNKKIQEMLNKKEISLPINQF